MSGMEQFFYLLLVLFLAWIMYGYIRNNKGAFSMSNFLKSMHTLGVLALCLIAFIALCIYGLKTS